MGAEQTELDSEQRKRLLDEAVSASSLLGWDVHGRSDYQAVLIRPAGKVNHILHLILTLLTAGLWLFVWVILVLARKKERRQIISVDKYGDVSRTV
jgi:hypothetical protein